MRLVVIDRELAETRLKFTKPPHATASAEQLSSALLDVTLPEYKVTETAQSVLPPSLTLLVHPALGPIAVEDLYTMFL